MDTSGELLLVMMFKRPLFSSGLLAAFLFLTKGSKFYFDISSGIVTSLSFVILGIDANPYIGALKYHYKNTQ